MPNVSTLTTEDPVLLVQLTDSHLFADADGSLLGLNTAQSLQRVIERVRAEQPQIDLLLATGDLTQDGSVAAYQRFRQLTEPLSANARWIPGNHDAWPSMLEATVQSRLLEQVVDIGNWRITLLRSNVYKKSHGYLDDTELQLLVNSLSEAPDRHHLIALHHHPVEVGCEWIESIGLHNANAFWGVLERFPQVKALLWGHIHQPFDQQQKGVRLLASPSTCVQFTPASRDFSVSSEAPGYRWLRLQPDGTLDTGVSRVDNFVFEPDYSANNY
ncbi:3',5'-cyclic-AMP phosphodiesterase [Pseudomonas sp. CCC3.1]|uniref:3',5'-cyclic-AMP phosphodiesterase n=1 Tax=Pseudomonas sp. CCC3.1 TaxID=3048607 RepID=UPI002AC9EF44|nr:3',5'-cyclic-AMP phosphodiesterase [Pseudomonas sp. CCC3.1]MEB0204821.1 3',5'-cyclic-AMP phosphodiesterase [Pseudomonas sp. CCC3.1]WPX35689.1 3',5'-cyclic-AMP phosphodiesterase [Pseudomonas sp. CCC3.1]